MIAIQIDWLSGSSFAKYHDNYFEFHPEKNEIVMTEQLYAILNDDLFKRHRIHIRDCIRVTISTDDFESKENNYYCEDMSADELIFSKAVINKKN